MRALIARHDTSLVPCRFAVCCFNRRHGTQCGMLSCGQTFSAMWTASTRPCAPTKQFPWPCGTTCSNQRGKNPQVWTRPMCHTSIAPQMASTSSDGHHHHYHQRPPTLTDSVWGAAFFASFHVPLSQSHCDCSLSSAHTSSSSSMDAPGSI